MYASKGPVVEEWADRRVFRPAGWRIATSLLQAYLPDRMNAEAVLAAVRALVARLDAKGPADMGRVMAAAKAELAGKAEMAQVSAAVKQALAG